MTIPSQRRYVGYYASLVQEQLNYHPVRLLVKEIHLEPMPTFNGGQACKFSEVIDHDCILAVDIDVELHICNRCLHLECVRPFISIDEAGNVACKGV